MTVICRGDEVCDFIKNHPGLFPFAIAQDMLAAGCSSTKEGIKTVIQRLTRQGRLYRGDDFCVYYDHEWSPPEPMKPRPEPVKAIGNCRRVIKSKAEERKIRGLMSVFSMKAEVDGNSKDRSGGMDLEGDFREGVAGEAPRVPIAELGEHSERGNDCSQVR